MTQDTKIEVIRMHRFDNEGPVKAFCDIQIGEEYIVKGFRVVDGKEGPFVGMPSGIAKTGKWFNTFTPLTADVKNRIETAIISAYGDQ